MLALLEGREQKHAARFTDKVGLWQSQFTPAQSLINPECLLHQHIPSCLSLSRPSQHREPSGLRGSGQKSTIATFSPLSPRTPGAPISPCKTTGNPFSCKHALLRGIFRSLFGPGGCCPHFCISFWQPSVEEPLISTTCIPRTDWGCP